jgi:hypothetical protein
MYALSHFGFLSIHESNHELRNTVFPFLTNWQLYLVAALVEFVLGAFCLKNAGRDITNLAVLTFVGALIWYRWAFHYTGGVDCGCLGLLGILFHLNSAEQRMIPSATLIALFLTTTPWLFGNIRRLYVRLAERRALVVVFVFTVGTCQMASAEGTITITGRVDYQEFNPQTKKPYVDQESHNTFVATLSGGTWRFCVTNLVWTKWWGQVAYDGTNCYTILPFSRALTIPFGNVNTNPPEGDSLVANIEPSGRFIQHRVENIGLFPLWLTYGLRKELIVTNKIGLVEIPFSGARVNPGCFGFGWKINFSQDGRFVSNCVAVRDKALDLPHAQELLRFELDYPDTLAEYNKYQKLLSNREATPTGFLKARYSCTEWLTTNGWTVPMASKYEVYLTSRLASWPWRIVELRASKVSISVQDSSGSPLPEITVPTRVQDYRYKKKNKNHIFKYAEYTLKPDDAWKSADDPALLAQADEWLKRGRPYTDFAGKPKVWVAWLVFVVLVSPICAVFCLRKKQKVHK